jgi:hypothetical protein
MSDAVLFDARADGIAIITLNRPETRNCLAQDIREGLYAAWDRFEHDPVLRIAILTGSGEKAFCAGGDLKEMVETGMQVPPRDMFPLPYDTVELSKPTIAAVSVSPAGRAADGTAPSNASPASRRTWPGTSGAGAREHRKTRASTGVQGRITRSVSRNRSSTVRPGSKYSFTAATTVGKSRV